MQKFSLVSGVLASAAFIAASFSPVRFSECDKVPDLNRKVHSFVKSSIGKKLGRGECWDLAAQALNGSGAAWDGAFRFGDPVDPLKDCVYPGDIIQYTNVRVKYTLGNTQYVEEMDQHTAIVYEVKKRGSYTVAEQNTTRHGRKVGLSDFALDHIVKGKTEFFRPKAK